MIVLLDYVRVGQWMRQHGFAFPCPVRRREDLFDLVGSEVGNRRTLYMEFGVWQGASMRYWSKTLSSPSAILHGFDSFEGLPEVWRDRDDKGQGHFSTRGAVPDIPDPRVRFFPGWFDQVLPGYTPPPHDVLVINVDADLYSSTLCVLRSLRGCIREGTFIYFDEFSVAADEPRAFDDFIQESGYTFCLRGADRTLTHVLFQCTSGAAADSVATTSVAPTAALQPAADRR